MADTLFIMSPKASDQPQEKTAFSDQEKSLDGHVDQVDGSISKLQRRLQSRHLQMIAIGM